jgi:hypothetical protein
LPEFYSDFLSQDLLSLPIDEKAITCHQCLQVPQFKPQLKCCTFHPILPNYLVGQILLQEAKQPSFISAVLKHKISCKNEVYPIGVAVPAEYKNSYPEPDQPGFGQRQELLCPYFDKKNLNCGIWQNRGSVCTSYFCQSSKGSQGLEFWSRLGDYLHLVEMALAQEVLAQMGFSALQINQQLDLLQGESLDPEGLWNGYSDPEIFYLKSLEIVKTLDRSSFKELLGPEGQDLLNEVLKLGKIWK